MGLCNRAPMKMLIGLIWLLSPIGIVLVGRLYFFGGLSERLGRTIFLVCCLTWLGSSYYIWSDQQQKAVTAGFESSQDQRDAKKAGFTDAEAWKAEKLRRSGQPK